MDLIDDRRLKDAPKTFGVKYAGSKRVIIPQILNVVSQLNVDRVFDGFSGTTRVSQAFAQQGYVVHSNDLSDWSYHFATAFLKNQSHSSKYQDIIDHLNNLQPESGWFTEHYGGQVNGSDEQKKPWQVHNTAKLDSIRAEIDQLKPDDITRSVLLTSLIFALDEVDNTLGHHSSYLRDWSARSYKTMQLKVPELWVNEHKHTVTQSDVFDVANTNQAQLAYYDPPYGSNNEKMPPSRVRYSAYYHLWTTICRNDKPEIFGKAGRRADSSDTITMNPFENYRKLENGQYVAVEAIDRLLKTTCCEWILLSYSSGGRATAEQLNDSIHSHGKLIKSIEIEYQKHVMASMQSTKNWLNHSNAPHLEYLLLIRKS